MKEVPRSADALPPPSEPPPIQQDYTNLTKSISRTVQCHKIRYGVSLIYSKYFQLPELICKYICCVFTAPWAQSKTYILCFEDLCCPRGTPAAPAPPAPQPPPHLPRLPTLQ